jgi:hypothetical protein
VSEPTLWIKWNIVTLAVFAGGVKVVEAFAHVPFVAGSVPPNCVYERVLVFEVNCATSRLGTVEL